MSTEEKLRQEIMRINIDEELEEESGSDQESSHSSSPEYENELARQDSQHPLHEEEEEDRYKQHIPVKAVGGGRKGNMKGHNHAIDIMMNQSDYKTRSTLTEVVRFPKERFKKFVSTTYNDWFYDRQN